ncbi:hypothetical protein BDN72DRAFT_586070 [Pluteus cervinus]|uniref:Uncharacterized protein n=1 Tax=Pluteus cervinus TaxID=181527 RepID=A0ACD3AVM9_9AGAR|nr:hypothetical protein BDN72DRAFT_586070 [Pluteus cervinus]
MCSLIPDKGALSRYQRYYRQNLAQILTDIYEKEWQKEQPSPANPLKIEIDLVQDLISVACLRWVCDHLCGSGDFINIKTMEPKKLQQVFEQLNSLYAFASGMVDSSAAWEARENAIQTIEGLKKQIDQKLPPRERGMGIREAMNERFGSSWQRWSRVYTELLHPQGRQVQPEVQTFLHRIFRLSTSIKIDDLLFTDHHLQEMRTRMFEQHRNEKPYNLNLPSVARHVLASRIQAHVDDDIDRIRMISNVCGLVILASSKLAHVYTFAKNMKRNGKK